MSDSTGLSVSAVDGAAPGRGRLLLALVERMQMASGGGPELDAALAGALGRDRAASWSTDLDETLALVPDDHNFSLGQRDGVCWAWIQPNTRWEPSPYEARHDHPGGSGLVVARTAPLALACAALTLRMRGMV